MEAKAADDEGRTGVMVLSVLEGPGGVVVRMTSAVGDAEPSVRAVTDLEEVVAAVRNFLVDVSPEGGVDSRL